MDTNKKENEYELETYETEPYKKRKKRFGDRKEGRRIRFLFC